jgi:acetyl-CoA carboxylase carboxyl transferase subunit beta
MLYAPRFARTDRVCPDCGWHDVLTAPQRIEMLLDSGSVEMLSLTLPDADPLGFVDSRPYPDRIRDARRQTGLDEAVLCATGTVDGNRVVVAAMDFRFMGGSLGSAVGEAIAQAADRALADRVPLLIVSASGGARMQEGVISLMMMAKTANALAAMGEAGLLTVSLVTDPTFGGVAASFATLADVIVAEPGARLGFAGPRVIEQTIKQTLPEGFQTAEFLLTHGIVDLIRPRTELRASLARLFAVASAPRLGSAADQVGTETEPAEIPAETPAEAVIRDPGRLPIRDPWDVVQLARRLARPTTLDFAGMLLDDFNELHGDRMSADCPAIVAGLGRLNGIPVALIGTQKGHQIEELSARNFGMPTPAGYRKAARIMRLAAKLSIPVITLIDTAGAYPGIVAEEQGQAVAVAENLALMGGLPVPVIALVTGEGGSGGALALAVADQVLMCANAVYSVISPEGCAAILWKDPAAAPQAAAALQVDARHLLALGVIEGVVPEPEGGSDQDPVRAGIAVREALLATLQPLMSVDSRELVLRRRARFRRFGLQTTT